MKKDTLLSDAGVSEIELVYRSKVKYSEQPKICCSKDLYRVLKKVWDEDKIDFVEQFKVVLLNRANMECHTLNLVFS
jgi:DNA repair protein RadC